MSSANNQTADLPGVILVTGIMAAGKSTVAQALAERLPRSIHLRGDVFRRMIVSGRAEMGFPLSAEAERQLDLRYRLAATAAGLYYAAGFTVVYQDIIIGRGLTAVLPHFRAMALALVVLCPNAETVAAREAARAKKGYGDLAISDFDRVLRTETPRIGLWVDSSDFSVDQTVDYIFAHLSVARITPASA